MTKKERAFLLDLQGFIAFALSKKGRWCYHEILFNLSHDIHGIAMKDKFFLPRLKGYSKHLK